MIEVKTESRHGYESKHTVYEKHELIPNGKFCFEWQVMTQAMRGDYVRDYHGRQIPVLFRQTLKRATGRDLMMVFPGQTWLASKHAHKPFVWSLSPRSSTKVNLRHKLFAEMISKGVDEVAAYHAVWTSVPKKAIPYRLLGLYCNENFIMLFLEVTGLMTPLKQALIDHGMDTEKIATRLIGLVDDSEAPIPLRKMAFEKVIDILQEKTQAPSAGEIMERHTLKPGEMAVEMRALIGQNTSQALPGGKDSNDLGSAGDAGISEEPLRTIDA